MRKAGGHSFGGVLLGIRAKASECGRAVVLVRAVQCEERRPAFRGAREPGRADGFGEGFLGAVQEVGQGSEDRRDKTFEELVMR